MLKRISKKQPENFNRLASYLVDTSTDDVHGNITLPSKQQVSALMAEMGRRGGKVGGKRRLETMTAKERSAVARKAAKARWEREEE